MLKKKGSAKALKKCLYEALNGDLSALIAKHRPYYGLQLKIDSKRR